MNDRQLRSFVAVAEEGSFSAAARKCYITTSAIIQQINSLEQNLGFILFLRGFHGLSLTPAGERFLSASKAILTQYDEACIECAMLDQKNLELKFAYQFEELPAELLKCYQTFCQKHVSIHVEFIPVSFVNEIDALRSGKVDIGAIAEPSSASMKGLKFIPIREDTLSFCMSREHPLAGLKKITPEDLKGYVVEGGRYPYMKFSFPERLAEFGIACEETSGEYSFATQLTHLVSDKIFVIHSMWEKYWSSFLQVIPSDLSAGRVGLLTRENPPAAAHLFISECEQYFKL